MCSVPSPVCELAPNVQFLPRQPYFRRLQLAHKLSLPDFSGSTRTFFSTVALTKPTKTNASTHVSYQQCTSTPTFPLSRGQKASLGLQAQLLPFDIDSYPLTSSVDKGVKHGLAKGTIRWVETSLDHEFTRGERMSTKSNW